MSTNKLLEELVQQSFEITTNLECNEHALERVADQLKGIRDLLENFIKLRKMGLI